MSLTEDSSAGKQKAFTDAYKSLHDRLVRFVQTMIWNKEDVKDIVAETLLKSYEKFETIRHPDALLSFMFTTSSRLVYKRQNAKKIMTEMPDYLLDTLVDGSATAEHKLELKELYEALQELPEKQRETVVMFEISGLSLNEIMEIQGDSLSAVKSRLTRGREKLSEILEQETV